MQALFQISRINTALGIGSYGNVSFICTSSRWRHWSLTVRVSRFDYLHPIKVPQCLNRPWASKEYQPLSTNTEHILTIVYLVVDPDSQNQEYMLQRLKPLSHHIHWECRTQCSRHQSYASFQYHIHNTWFITTFGGILPVFSGKSSGLHNQAVRGTAQISQAKFKVPPTGPSSLQPIRASAWLCFLESNLLGNSPCWLFFTWQ